ncbi:hypothetical protein JL721_8379 [Aureococcus anophagefferens]|nr:hypothetical protein JL721_8379 [Aureococcus anophagefferens]
MDDTYVDVDALAWHLGDLDDAQPWRGRRDARVALGAGWALSGPAAALAAAHLDLYFSLASGMVRASDGGREWALPASRLGRALADAGRGMRLDSHIADDVFFGTFMAALGVGAAGPRGFTQAPVDARGGVPPCGPAAAAAAESRGPDDADCGDPQRHHDLGAVWLSDPATGALVEVDDLVAAGSCRRPFAGPPSCTSATRSAASTTRGGGASSATSTARWPTARRSSRPTNRRPSTTGASAPSSLVVAGEVREISVSACDDPAAVGRAFCDAAVGPGGAACREQVAGQAAQLVAARFCEAHGVDGADCVAVAAAAANLQPPLARAWCPR